MAKIGIKEAGIGLSLTTTLPVLAIWSIWESAEKIAMVESAGPIREVILYMLKAAAVCITTGAVDQAWRILEGIKQHLVR